MLTQTACRVVFIVFTLSPLTAQEIDQQELRIPHLLAGSEQDGNSAYQGDRSVASPTTATRLDAHGPTQAMLEQIVVWLSQNFDLRATNDLPKVALIPAAELVFLRYQAFTAAEQRKVMTELGADDPAARRREPVALYHGATKTIFLASNWTGATPAEVSILVHEMVHHLQNLQASKYACPQEREKLAYAAQEKWLALAGRNLIDEFELDPFTLLASTLCMH